LIFFDIFLIGQTTGESISTKNKRKFQEEKSKEDHRGC